MSGLVAIFNPKGISGSPSDLVGQFPGHAAMRDEWQDPYCTVVRLHHGVGNAAPQPVWNESRKICIFMDGELFETGDAMPLDGAAPVSAPAICLRLYEEERPEAFARLNGSFALIVYDTEHRRITLVSDCHDTRPLYYFSVGSELVVASHIAALTAHPRCPKALDRQALHELVAYQRVIGRRTIYHNVHRLEPATMLSFDGRFRAPRSYWELRWREPSFSKKEAPMVLADGMRQTVKRWLSQDLRCGLLLSGGLDSRTILAAADRPPVCFTMSVTENYQVRYARKAARLKGAEFHYVPVDPRSFWEHFDEAVRLTGGMYGAQQNHFLPILDIVNQHCDTVSLGHNIGALFRGVFLPTRTLAIGRRSVRLPWLANVRSDCLVAAILSKQKYAFPRALVHRILTAEARGEHMRRLQDTVQDILRDFLPTEASTLQNAWDYLCLRSAAQHFTYPNLLCLRSRMDERVVAWDRELFDIYLQMPPQWRFPDTIFRAALGRLSRPLARLTYADTGLPGNIGPHAEAFLAPAKYVLQPIRVESRLDRSSSTGPSPWPNFASLLRDYAPLRARLQGLPDSEALGACGIFDPRGVRTVSDQHLSGTQDHDRFLLMLLTIDGWIDQFGADGVA